MRPDEVREEYGLRNLADVSLPGSEDRLNRDIIDEELLATENLRLFRTADSLAGRARHGTTSLVGSACPHTPSAPTAPAAAPLCPLRNPSTRQPAPMAVWLRPPRDHAAHAPLPPTSNRPPALDAGVRRGRQI